MSTDTPARSEQAPQSAGLDQSPIPKGAWLILATVLGASIMNMLDATVTNIAGPSIIRSLHASSSDLQWIISGYTLPFAVLLIAGGRLGDIVGRRRMLLLGLSGFIVFSALCSLAASPDELIATRAIQGSFSALMIPQGIGIIRGAFPKDQLGKPFAVFGPFMGLSAMLGPTLGGVLIDYAGGWRSVFLVNVPIGLAALCVAAKVLPRDHRSDGLRPKLDFIGLLLLSTAMFLLVYPLIDGREAGWPAWAFLMMGGSAVVLALFGGHQRLRRRAGRDPFVEPELFRNRGFALGVVTIFLFFGACSGVFLVGTLLLQTARGYSALHAGLTMAFWWLGAVGGIVATQKFVASFPRRVLQAGLTTMSIGFVATALTVQHYTPNHGAGLTTWTLAPALAVSGTGMGMIFAPFFGIVLSAVQDHQVGSASGVLNAVEQLSGAVGVAALGTVFFNDIAAHGGDYLTAARLVYWIAAGVVALAWALAFFVPKTARPADDMY